MRTIDNNLIKTIVTNFSHGAGTDYDPNTSAGCQGESFSDLGFGWVYFSLAKSQKTANALVIGSGRGFSAACIALGIEDNTNATVTLVDPSYTSWNIDGAVSDSADGFWETEQQAKEHFKQHLGLNNINFIRSTSNDAFSTFTDNNELFDLILIDGNHRGLQVNKDIDNAFKCLTPNGIILVHDSNCPHLPGVSLAIERVRATQSEVEIINLPQYPGLAILKRITPLVTIRKATVEENIILNDWRTADNVLQRPLEDPRDPRAGESSDDPHDGLFAAFVNNEMIAGFGLKKCHFTGAGADNFLPDDGYPTHGYLLYAGIIRHDRRHSKYLHFAFLEIFRWLGSDGFFTITSHRLKELTFPYTVKEVGRTEQHTAYWYRPINSTTVSTTTTEYISRIKAEKQTLQQKQTELEEQVTATKGSLANTNATLNEIRSSIIWRSSAPLRKIFDRLRGK